MELGAQYNCTAQWGYAIFFFFFHNPIAFSAINTFRRYEPMSYMYLISFVRFGSVRKRRLTCEICSLISCSIYQLPFWLKIQFVITHFRLIGLSGPGWSLEWSSFSSFRAMDHSAGFPPAPSALSNQQRILQSRFPPARSRDEDEVRSTTGSVSSWVEVPAGEEAPDSDGLEMPSADLRLGTANKMDPIPEHGPNAPSMAPPQLHTAAPVTQAARNFVDHTNEPAAARRLRKQQEMAQRKGRRGARFVQLGAHDACNIALPPHIQQVGSGQGERSIMVLDHRDLRLQSPFQGWLLDEILTNAGARINIQSDARLVRSPTTGYHCNMFMLKTLDNFKLVIAGSMTSYGSVPCGKWDSATGEVLSHDAFQPFRWPVMRNDSPTWVDFKIISWCISSWGAIAPTKICQSRSTMWLTAPCGSYRKRHLSRHVWSLSSRAGEFAPVHGRLVAGSMPSRKVELW